MANMTEEQGQAVMAKWGVWMEKVGSSLVDVGTPFGPSASVVDDGTSRAAVNLSGYSIIEASDMSDARSKTDKHPYLSDGTGEFSIDIFEMMPVPFEQQEAAYLKLPRCFAQPGIGEKPSNLK